MPRWCMAFGFPATSDAVYAGSWRRSCQPLVAVRLLDGWHHHPHGSWGNSGSSSCSIRGRARNLHGSIVCRGGSARCMRRCGRLADISGGFALVFPFDSRPPVDCRKHLLRYRRALVRRTFRASGPGAVSMLPKTMEGICPFWARTRFCAQHR